MAPLARLALVQDDIVTPHIRPGERADLAGTHAGADREQHRPGGGLRHGPATHSRIARPLEQAADLAPVNRPLAVRRRPRPPHVAHWVGLEPAPLPAGVLDRSRQDGHVARYGGRLDLAEPLISPLPKT